MENPNPSQITLNVMADKVHAFPCSSCGAKLSFSPGSKTLKCPYCSTTNDIPDSNEGVEELDLQTWLAKQEAEHETHEQEHIKCSNCGGEQTLAANLFATACTFCGSPLTSKSYAQRQIKPKSLVPFKITKLQAQEKWREWIRGLWFAPTKLKQFAQSDGGIKGLYVPYWTFDAQTYTNYTGLRGVDHQESYETTDSKGERSTETRTRTDWTNVSGNVSYFHNDVLVAASASLATGGDKTNTLANDFRTWNTMELVPYQDEYITGFQAEAYQVGLKDAFGMGKQKIDNRVERLVCSDIGGDHQRITSLNTQYSELTFKHILLPMWVSAYMFNGKTYRFLVNGQSGEVVGENPTSGWKVFFLVAGVLAVVLILFAVFGKGID